MMWPSSHLFSLRSPQILLSSVVLTLGLPLSASLMRDCWTSWPAKVMLGYFQNKITIGIEPFYMKQHTLLLSSGRCTHYHNDFNSTVYISFLQYSLVKLLLNTLLIRPIILLSTHFLNSKDNWLSIFPLVQLMTKHLKMQR